MTARKTMGRTRTARLRIAVDALPRDARVTMLDAVREETIVAGAYVTGNAGVCPMLAVHRRGVRTDANRFARAWDQFCGVAQGQVRVATERELTTLVAMLHASLLADEHVDLHAAVADHRVLRRDRHTREAVDLAAIRAEHQVLARERRAREAEDVGTGWLHDPVGMPISRDGSPRCADLAAASRAVLRATAPELALG